MTIEVPVMACSVATRSRLPGEYPCEVHPCEYGKCLVALVDLPEGAVVEKFEGQIIPNDQVPAHAARHVIIWDDASMMLPETPARYANHSCDPNSYVNDLMEIVTLRPVKHGEEITFSYNWIYGDSSDAPWDDRWSFRCKCGSPRCQGVINKYVRCPST